MPNHPLYTLVDMFLDSGNDSYELYCPEDGEVVDGMVFRITPETEPERVYNRLYQGLAKRGLLKTRIWLRKDGRSIWLHSSEESYREARRRRG